MGVHPDSVLPLVFLSMLIQKNQVEKNHNKQVLALLEV